MDYESALHHARKGALIKRPHWNNPLRHNGRRLEFVTPVLAYGKKPDTKYNAQGFELQATDWEIAEEAKTPVKKRRAA